MNHENPPNALSLFEPLNYPEAFDRSQNTPEIEIFQVVGPAVTKEKKTRAKATAKPAPPIVEYSRELWESSQAGYAREEILFDPVDEYDKQLQVSIIDKFDAVLMPRPFNQSYRRQPDESPEKYQERKKYFSIYPEKIPKLPPGNYGTRNRTFHKGFNPKTQVDNRVGNHCNGAANVYLASQPLRIWEYHAPHFPTTLNPTRIITMYYEREGKMVVFHQNTHRINSRTGTGTLQFSENLEAEDKDNIITFMLANLDEMNEARKGFNWYKDGKADTWFALALLRGRSLTKISQKEIDSLPFQGNTTSKKD